MDEKGHKDLGSRLAGESFRTIGKRHALRLMSDAYGKGIVRGQAENTNLRTYSKENQVTYAECIMTAQTEMFHGRAFVNSVELLNDLERLAAHHEMTREGVSKHVPLDGAVEARPSAGARQHPFGHVAGQ